MSELTKQNAGGAVAALGSLQKGLTNIKTSTPTAGGFPFLKMAKDGIWSYGVDDTEPEDEQKFAVNPLSMEHGSIAWLQREEGSKEPAKLLGERMVSMMDPKPAEADLPAIEDGKWMNQLSFNLRGVGGEDDGIEVQYKTNSVGGLKAVTSVVDAILAQLSSGTDKVVPLVVLSHDTYMHKSYGKTYVPEIDIVDWITMEGPEDAEPTDAKDKAKDPEGAGSGQKETDQPEDAGDKAEQAPEEGGKSRRRRRR